MSSTLSLMPKGKVFKESGSAFDATNFEAIKSKAGGHETVPRRDIDVSAFSLSKKTNRMSPLEFTKKRTGNGGTMLPKPEPTPSAFERAEAASLSRKPKMLTAPAFCARPNPPNTELRRFYERGDLPIQIGKAGTSERSFSCRPPALCIPFNPFNKLTFPLPSSPRPRPRRSCQPFGLEGGDPEA